MFYSIAIARKDLKSSWIERISGLLLCLLGQMYYVSFFVAEQNETTNSYDAVFEVSLRGSSIKSRITCAHTQWDKSCWWIPVTRSESDPQQRRRPDPPRAAARQPDKQTNKFRCTQRRQRGLKMYITLQFQYIIARSEEFRGWNRDAAGGPSSWLTSILSPLFLGGKRLHGTGGVLSVDLPALAF